MTEEGGIDLSVLIFIEEGENVIKFFKILLASKEDFFFLFQLPLHLLEYMLLLVAIRVKG